QGSSGPRPCGFAREGAGPAGSRGRRTWSGLVSLGVVLVWYTPRYTPLGASQLRSLETVLGKHRVHPRSEPATLYLADALASWPLSPGRGGLHPPRCEDVGPR